MSVIEGTFDVSGFIDTHTVRGRQYAVTVLYGLVMFLDGLDTQSISYAAPLIAKEWTLPHQVLGPIFSSRPDRPDGWLPFHIPLIGSLRSSTNDDRQHNRLWPVHRAQRHNNQCYRAFGLALPDRCRAGRRGAKRGHLDERIQSEAVACDIRTSDLLRFLASIRRRRRPCSVAAAVARMAFAILVGAAAPLIISFFLVTLLPEVFHFLINSGASSEKVRDVLHQFIPGAQSLADAQRFAIESKSGRIAIYDLFKGARGVGTVIIWVVFFLNLAEFYALQSWLPTILIDHHYPLGMVALATTSTTIGGIVVAVVIGLAMDRLGAYGSLAVLYLLGVAFVAFMGMAINSPKWVLLTATFPIGVCGSAAGKKVQ